jgi:hypothetical protein
MRSHRLAFVAMAMLGIVMTGCVAGKYTGGGWTLTPYDAEGKAIFGGNFQAIDENGNGEVYNYESGEFDPEDTFKGQIQYNDLGAGVAFHGVVDGGYICDSTDNVATFPLSRPSNWSIYGAGYLEGTYTPQPKGLGEGGRFEILVIDNGEPGADPGDEIWVALYGGVLHGYNSDDTPGDPEDDGVFGQLLEGGNLKFNPSD